MELQAVAAVAAAAAASGERPPRRLMTRASGGGGEFATRADDVGARAARQHGVRCAERGGKGVHRARRAGRHRSGVGCWVLPLRQVGTAGRALIGPSVPLEV